ncbi:programmed cell death 1 ligand 1 isoform X2 [Hemicordylus capensis]|nr:programmed cell death 1 ligand 1 isoform X2 [Hemicordylus capensis]XP_053158855.1 programmed cell death 1 ligand 1 isoform X2 [Hemicordylus capensis]XP_053158856.1 programmed cell death 1 ligand 1 isoform X2 [Hemicordylus capensis]XP_053158857.1 programmed cell death 1 ligand 1 isoform X2 [Hemicordylus capensis]XP_053158858.1 programmed cell death 1 ligand 1 isoform X2 [Hemicordylus capensis]XP_053158859.1 programmed cell death 1 ligand 1 isoform X2 [Hemicordylus capensis]
METLLFVYLLVSQFHFLNALFTVEAYNPLYVAEYGNNVTMECRFPVEGQLKLEQLSIIWEKKEEPSKKVYKLHKGKEDLKTQHSIFRNRVALFKDKLSLGHVVLQVTKVTFTDAGIYLCIVDYEGADYKDLLLDVIVPYRNIRSTIIPIHAIDGPKEWELTCQSEGYPVAEVFWNTKDRPVLLNKANTTYKRGPNQLYHVTSMLRVNINVTGTFYCIFWNKVYQENTTATLNVTGPPQHIQRMNRRLHFGTVAVVCAILGSLLLFAFWSKIMDRSRRLGCNLQITSEKSNGRNYITVCS